MKGFYFDLIALPRSVYWLRAVMLLLGVLALAAVAGYGQLQMYPELSQRRQEVRAALENLGSAPSTSAMNPKDLAQAWQQARSVSVQLGLPWKNFFVQLGNASKSGDVAFISIEPDSQKGHVLLVAEARSLEAMLQFLSHLQSSPDFSEVALQSHAMDKTTPEKPVRFRVSATWRIAP
jgi:Tfp pilus assembly protein PilN